MSIENVKIDYENTANFLGWLDGVSTEVFLEWVNEVSFFVDQHGRQGYKLILTNEGIEALGVKYLTVYEDGLEEKAIAFLENS